MKSVEAPQATFPAVGEESFEAVRRAVRQALAEPGRAGRPVVVRRGGEIVEIVPDENGDSAE